MSEERLNLSELKAKSPAELQSLAEEWEIENASTMRKGEMMFSILKVRAESGAEIDVFTLDTGRLFPEVLETVELSELRYRVRIRLVAPDAQEIEELVARDGTVVGREGDIVEGYGGGASDDGAFHVCISGG